MHTRLFTKEKLSRRVKKPNETYPEYIHQMLKIALQADKEISADVDLLLIEFEIARRITWYCMPLKVHTN